MSNQTTDRQVIPTGEFIDIYEVIDLIGVGSFGGVYQVQNKNTNIIYAMKTENFNSKKQLLQFEIQVLKEIDGDYFPKYIDSGFNEKYKVNYLIMSYLGASIDEIQDYHDANLDLKVAYNLSLKMLEPIKVLHKFGIIHRDIKPNNFLIQQNLKYPIVLVDFNLSARFINPGTHKPYPCIKEKMILGTRLFSSIDVLSSRSCGPKDDLIAWFYSFLYITCGTLPWAEEQNTSNLISMKKSFKLSDLNYEFPAQFQQIYDYLQKLKYEDTPDYNLIENLFVNGMKEDSIYPDSFDWSGFISEHSDMVQFEEEISKLTLNIINKRNRKCIIIE